MALHDDPASQAGNTLSTVRVLLMHEWDPIGIKHVPECQDEYGEYAGPILAMLLGEEVTHEAIAAYLQHVATQLMCIVDEPWLRDRSQRVATSLMATRREF